MVGQSQSEAERADGSPFAWLRAGLVIGLVASCVTVGVAAIAQSPTWTHDLDPSALFLAALAGAFLATYATKFGTLRALGVAVLLAMLFVPTGLVAAGTLLGGGVLGGVMTLACLFRLREAGWLCSERLHWPDTGQTPLRKTSPFQADPLWDRLLLAVLVSLLLALVVFVNGEALDLEVSALFHDSRRGFTLNHSEALQTLREVYWTAVLATVVVSLVLFFHGMRATSPNIPARVSGYVLAGLLVGPGLLANAVLKSNFGRVRPADVEAFGGEGSFTLPFQIAGKCTSNCSFVSGEGSGISMLAIVLTTLAWPHLGSRRAWILTGIVLVAGFGIGLRVAMGRHFLSDTVFAVLLMAFVALLLYRWLRIGELRGALSMDGLSKDLKAFGSYLAGGSGAAQSLREDSRWIVSEVLGMVRALWKGTSE
ncbi:MAG: phosphatase PAP2 family protein [Pseudomonadota bacterium]